MKKIRCIAAVLSVTVIMSVCAAPANAETDSSDASAFVQEGSYSDYIAEYDYTNSCWFYLLNMDFLRNSNIFFKEGIYLEDILFTTQVLLEARRVAKVPVFVYYYYQRQGSTMHNNVDQVHLNRLLYDYYQVSFFISEILKNQRKVISDKCWNVVDSHKNNLIFFMLVKLLRMRFSKDKIKEYINLLEKHQMYPFACPVRPKSSKRSDLTYYLIYRILINKKLLLLIATFYGK